MYTSCKFKENLSEKVPHACIHSQECTVPMYNTVFWRIMPILYINSHGYCYTVRYSNIMLFTVQLCTMIKSIVTYGSYY